MSAYTVQSISDKQKWEDFNCAQPLPQFLQSWSAGEQAIAQGESVVRFGLHADGRLVSILSGTIIRAKRGSYLLVQYGPILTEQDRIGQLQAWALHLQKWGKEQQLVFLRVCPFLPDTPELRHTFTSAGFQVSPIHTLAERVWLLDLTPSEEQLLMGTSKTTRNLIRRAAKDGVIVTQSTSSEDLDHFLRLHRATKDRHAFTPYPDSLFREQVRAFAKDNQVSIFCARHGDTVLASAIIMYYGGMASYHHGASIPSKIPAAYALQWAAILEAKRRNCSTYNFWGVTDLLDTKHPFYGISLFKTRFGGRGEILLKGQDMPLSRLYTAVKLIESIRRIKRGFGWRRD